MGREKKFYYLDSDHEKKNPLIYYAEHQPEYHKEYARNRKKQDPAYVLMKKEYNRNYRLMRKREEEEAIWKELQSIKVEFPKVRTMIKAVSEPRTLSWD